MAGPNAMTATRLALKAPHATPLLIASPTSRAASAARAPGAARTGASRNTVAITTRPSAAIAAAATSDVRHDVAVAKPPRVAAARPRPTGHAVSITAIAVAISRPANQSAVILTRRIFMR